MSRRLAFLAIAVSLLVAGSGSARSTRLAQVVDLPTQPLSSPNVHLLGTIPDTASVGGRFAGEYFFTTVGGTVAPSSPVGGLRIYSVADPEQPLLVGTLPLPHVENEDVDVSWSRKLVLISQDYTSGVGDPAGAGRLYVIDISNVRVPMLLSVLPYPTYAGTVGGKSVNGPGHIANCILDCRYAYITGARDGSVYVVNLKDPAHPSIVGKIFSPAGARNDVFTTGVVHDVNVDGSGDIWFTGSGGATMFAPITVADDAHVLHPTPLASVSSTDNKTYDQFILHNSLRLNGNTVLITEEDWEQPQCGDSSNAVNSAVKEGQQGSFETWHIGSGSITPIGHWETELGDYINGGAAVTVVCSSHWFSYNRNNVVAVGWYNQGVRFLDVSDPAHIRQVGYWMGPGGTVSAGLFVPWRPDIAYVPDYTRGLDIVKIDDGGVGAATIQAPVRAEWFAGYTGVRFSSGASLDPTWRWACARPL